EERRPIASSRQLTADSRIPGLTATLADPMDAVVLHIYIAPEAGAPMQGVEAAHAVPGLGLEGDRYHRQAGSFSRWPGPHRELTLIAEEDLAAMHRETGLLLPPEASRRNVLTRGVDLRTLIGCEFAIGPVRLRG